MGTVNREVLQVTTINTESERVTRPFSGTAPLNWFKGPVEDQSNFDRQTGVSTPAPIAITTTCITAEPRAKKTLWRHIHAGFDKWCNKFSNMDPVKLAYLRTSFVFAVSVLITWTPSSIKPRARHRQSKRIQLPAQPRKRHRTAPSGPLERRHILFDKLAGPAAGSACQVGSVQRYPERAKYGRRRSY